MAKLDSHLTDFSLKVIKSHRNNGYKYIVATFSIIILNLIMESDIIHSVLAKIICRI